MDATHFDISELPGGEALRELLRKCEPVDGGPALDGGKAALVVVKDILRVLCGAKEDEIDALDANTVVTKLGAILTRVAGSMRCNGDPFGHFVLQSMGPLDRTLPPFRRCRAIVLAGARTMHSRAGAALM